MNLWQKVFEVSVKFPSLLKNGYLYQVYPYGQTRVFYNNVHEFGIKDCYSRYKYQFYDYVVDFTGNKLIRFHCRLE